MSLRCVVRALALGAGMLAAPAMGEVRLQETRREYVLDATSVEALRAQIERGPPVPLPDRASHGLTRAEVEARYELEPSDAGGCRLEQIQVRLSVETRLPAWEPRGRPDRGLAPAVQAMLAGLARHEAGHRRNALKTASDIDARLRALAAAEDCPALQRAAQRVVSRALIRLRVHEWNYDRATDFGRRQGAWLDAEQVSRARRSAARR